MKKVIVIAMVFLMSARIGFAYNIEIEAVFVSSESFSNEQGKDGWYYNYRLFGNNEINPLGVFENNTWKVNAGTSEPFSIITSETMHAGNDRDTVRTFVATQNGRILLTSKGNVAKNVVGGDGVIVSVQKNNTKVFEKHLQGDDVNGFNYHIYLNVVKGDFLHFISNQNGESSYDSILWSPRVYYTSQVFYTDENDDELESVILGNVNANLFVLNPYDEIMECIAFAVIYGEDGRIMHVESEGNIIVEPGESILKTFTLDLSNYSNCAVRVHAYESLQRPKPLLLSLTGELK